MLNMIKMDLYRLFHTKSMYVIWIILAAAIILSTALLAAYDPMQVGTAEEQVQEDLEYENMNLGMTVMLPTEPGENVTLFDIVYAHFQGKFIALFLVIFAVMFSTADINSGYIKNIGGQVRNRGMLICSRAVALTVFTVISICYFVVLQAVVNQVFVGEVELGNLNDFIRYMGAQTVLHCALVLIVMAVSVLLKSNVWSIVIAVCMCGGVMMILYSAIDKVLYKIGVQDFNLITYTVTGKIGLLPMSLSSKDCMEAICISVVFIILATVLCSYVFKKRDI